MLHTYIFFFCLNMQINTLDTHQIFDNVLVQLAELCVYAQKRQERFGGWAVFPDLDTYIREFQTIRISSPRQCGKTSWIAKNIKSDWMVITPQFFKDSMVTNVHSFNERTDNVIYSGKELHKVDWSINKINTIILESADFVFDEVSRKQFYKLVASQGYNPDLRVILFN